jgi:hypothetical protein
VLQLPFRQNDSATDVAVSPLVHGRCSRDLGSGINASDTITLAPTLHTTAPLLANRVDINLSGKYLIPIPTESYKLFAANFGLALGPRLDRWAVRPEVGLLFSPDTDAYVTHFSLGLSVTSH